MGEGAIEGEIERRHYRKENQIVQVCLTPEVNKPSSRKGSKEA